MADYIIDQRGLPDSFDTQAQADFLTQAKATLSRRLGLTDDPQNQNTIAVIIGSVLNRGYFSAQGLDFLQAIESAWRASLAEVPQQSPPPPAPALAPTSARQVYDLVADQIPRFPGRGTPTVFFQEIAFVTDYVIANAQTVPVGHPNFGTQIRLGLDRYVEGLPPSQSLSLSLSLGQEGQDLSIEPENIRAVGTVLFCYHCEQLRLFHVTDRITELFMHGLLPVGFDAGGKLLDTYYWDAEDRLNEAARNMVYSRCLGVPGGDVSKDVQPNREFQIRFRRFVASLAEYDRQFRVTELLEAVRGGSLRLTAEQVRKSGRDLAANASLYGWGGTQFAARRLKDQVLESFKILSNTQIQKAYGVSNPYQVIERVSMNEFGAAPNIVKHKTMADASIAILEVVARRTNAWSTSSSRPLFAEPGLNGQALQPDIPPADQETLMLQAQNWLSVNGVPSEEIGKLSEPSDTVFAPSMPAFGAVNPAGDSDMLDKLKQMISSGSAPSLDQLQKLLPVTR